MSQTVDLNLKHKWHTTRGDKKWRFQFFVECDYRFLFDVIFWIIATFFCKSDNRYFAIIAEYFACDYHWYEIDRDVRWSFDETRFG
jgi:hypothetical protein